MLNGLSDFEQILQDVQKTKHPKKTYPEVALRHLGVTRRGWRVNEKIKGLLDHYDVLCAPDFGSAWFYGEIEIKPKPKVTAGKSITEDESDPIPRLSLLRASNLNTIKDGIKKEDLITINRDAKVSEAITLMLMNDFSQLPVMSNPRDVDGLISWKSIGKALGLGDPCSFVNECMDEVPILPIEEPLFNAVKIILDKEVVLVRQKDRTISGIVTATDIGEQFIAMAEPFLIIEQIENHIRKMMDGKFSIEEIKAAIDPNDSEREIKTLADLNFGEYLRIIEAPEKFSKLNIKIDRAIIIKQLEEVRQIRNDVMHFDPDGITPEALEKLRQTARFFHTVSTSLKRKR